jgi:hypothetical protein
MNLAHNLLTSLPTEIGLMSSLRYLNVSHHDIQGWSELGSLRQFYRSDALEIDLTAGKIPSELGQLGWSSFLKTLLLADNPSIRGSIPTDLGWVWGLTALDLSNTGVSGSIPSRVGEFQIEPFQRHWKRYVRNHSR